MLINILNLTSLLVSIIVYFIVNNLLIVRKQGFFCDDERIKYPYKESSISQAILIIIGIIIPSVIFIFGEMILLFKKNNFHCKNLMLSFIKIFFIYLEFLFYVMIITDFIKISVGNLRPHFYEKCNPVIQINNNTFVCDDFNKTNIYITNYICTNKDYNDQIRLSFPSKHSSFISFTMIFMILYWNKMKKEGIKIFSYSYIITFKFLIFVIIYVGVSRVVEFWHRWEDVICGYILGFIGNILPYIYFKNIESDFCYINQA